MTSSSSQILGPALFGMTYLKTVATMPTAIFFVSTGVIATSFFFQLCVRVPKPSASDVEAPVFPEPQAPTHEQDETLVDVDVPVIVVDEASPKIGSSSRS